ncbi:hypothetical protein MOVS_08750 [Moraxella ovis]|uniref:Uncharacterized protein n=1 Tax=Moraxella ovis TaxID=29433 RepID=A0A378PN37_9GAMM|nr:hypothetical protein [Moraxella ovis]ANB92047.1 hypothetical protein MOVS_08750 [Moraxella ovis]STY87806.1 Uncharacterised protein [Moraxella ovis]
MAHDASNNNPTKETLTALVGTVLLLVMIAAIGIFAWLRPAGEHQPKAPTAEEAAAEATVAPAEETAPAAEASTDTAEAPATQASDAAVAEAQDKLDQTPKNAQAPTQATATAETPAAASAPSDTTNAAPAPESAEDKEVAKTE